MHFVHISFTARYKSVITPMPTPQKICCTEGFVTISLKIDANSTIARNAGVTIPNVAAIAPRVPNSFRPVNIAVYAAIIPGRLAPSAYYSHNSSLVIHFFLSTSSLVSRGNITYPPPSNNVPTLKKVLKML